MFSILCLQENPFQETCAHSHSFIEKMISVISFGGNEKEDRDIPLELPHVSFINSSL